MQGPWDTLSSFPQKCPPIPSLHCPLHAQPNQWGSLWGKIRDTQLISDNQQIMFQYKYVPNIASWIFICQIWRHNSTGRASLSKPSWGEGCWSLFPSKTPPSPGTFFPAFPSLLSAFPTTSYSPLDWPHGEVGRKTSTRPASHTLPHRGLSSSLTFSLLLVGETLSSHLASPPRSLLSHTWHSPLNWQFGLSGSTSSCSCGGW